MRGPSSRTTTRAIAALLTLAAAPALSACAGEDDPDLVAGKQAFVEKCGSCHQLDRAATKGAVGPDLDEAFRQALTAGMGRDAVEGIVAEQIQHPARGSQMPANLVTGDAVTDVAAYVAEATASPGEDEGLLAEAVKKAGSDKPIAAENGKLVIPADPGGQLAYASTKATAPAGPIEVDMPNESGVPHDIVIDGVGKGEVVQDGGVSTFSGTLDAGQTYTFYCSVDGHRAAGMEGELSVER